MFGILVATWRMHSAISSVESTESYVFATNALCNCLRVAYNAVYTPVGVIDSAVLLNGEMQLGLVALITLLL